MGHEKLQVGMSREKNKPPTLEGILEDNPTLDPVETAEWIRAQFNFPPVFCKKSKDTNGQYDSLKRCFKALGGKHYSKLFTYLTPRVISTKDGVRWYRSDEGAPWRRDNSDVVLLLDKNRDGTTFNTFQDMYSTGFGIGYALAVGLYEALLLQKYSKEKVLSDEQFPVSALGIEHYEGYSGDPSEMGSQRMGKHRFARALLRVDEQLLALAKGKMISYSSICAVADALKMTTGTVEEIAKSLKLGTGLAARY